MPNKTTLKKTGRKFKLNISTPKKNQVSGTIKTRKEKRIASQYCTKNNTDEDNDSEGEISDVNNSDSLTEHTFDFSEDSNKAFPSETTSEKIKRIEKAKKALRRQNKKDLRECNNS